MTAGDGAGSRLRLRPATQADVPALRELVDEAYVVYTERIGRPPRPMTDDYSQKVRDWSVTVAEDDDGIAGLVITGPDAEGFVVDNVAVHPSRQGTGVGRMLLRHAESQAREAGFDSIYLYTHEVGVENIEMYGRAGYEEYARRDVGDAVLVFLRKPLP